MSGASIDNVEQLLSALGKERSLRGRLRVLGHSWKLLQALAPAERERVALRIGSKWAWKRVEKAFLEDGDLSENEQLVGRVFERMGSADPGELRKLARTIREGDSAHARDLLMMTLTEALEEEDEEDEATPVVPAPPVPGADRLPGQTEPESEPRVREGGAQDTPVPEARLVDRIEDVLTSSRARPVEEPATQAAAGLTPDAPRAVPAQQETAPAPAEPKPSAVAVRREPPAAPRPAAERPPPSTPTISRPERDDAAALEAHAPVGGADRLRVLRALERSDRPGADLGRAGRAALLESLGGGWASRRALTRMIRTRSLEGLDEALGLVQDLVRPGQQAWCLADLIEHWELDASELDRVLGAAPTDAARRRLQQRVGIS